MLTKANKWYYTRTGNSRMYPPSITSSTLSKKSSTLRHPFKTIFILFKMSTVFPIIFKSRSKCREKLLSAFSVVLLAFYAFPNLVTIFFSGISSVNIGQVATNCVITFQRYLLGRKMKRLRNIARFVQGHRVVESSSTKAWIYVWGALSTASHISLIVFSVVAMDSGPTHQLFAMSERSAAARISLYCLPTVNVVFFILPINTFSIFYVLVCSKMETVIRDFARTLREATVTDFRVLLPAYRSIKDAVGFLDSELSFLMLGSVVFSSLLMFLAVSLVLHPNPDFNWPMKAAIFSYFAISQASFLAMTAAASAVNEASAEVADAAEGMPEAGRDCMGAAKHKFMNATQNEVAFTVWKIVPIKRNFIVGTLGAIFTYVILIDGLKFT